MAKEEISWEIGKYYTLKRNSFIYRGIIVPSNSQVRLLEITSQGEAKVEFIDYEGNPHVIEGISLEELEPIE